MILIIILGSDGPRRDSSRAIDSLPITPGRAFRTQIYPQLLAG